MSGVGVSQEKLVHVARGLVLELEHAGADAAGADRFGVFGFLDDGDAGPFGELANGVGEGRFWKFIIQPMASPLAPQPKHL